MGCFEDYMQFRDEVDEAKKKIHQQRISDKGSCMKDQTENEKTAASPKP